MNKQVNITSASRFCESLSHILILVIVFHEAASFIIIALCFSKMKQTLFINSQLSEFLLD